VGDAGARVLGLRAQVELEVVHRVAAVFPLGMGGDKGRRLLFRQMLLERLEDGLRFGQRAAQMLDPLVRLLHNRDLLDLLFTTILCTQDKLHLDLHEVSSRPAAYRLRGSFYPGRTSHPQVFDALIDCYHNDPLKGKAKGEDARVIVVQVGLGAITAHYGVVGFLINPPIALYYIQGLNTTPIHAHTALFWVHGMLGIGLMLFCLRGLLPGPAWKDWPLATAFWAINVGLALMVLLSLLPIGLLQTWAAVEHGTWYARSAEFLQTGVMDTLRWLHVIGIRAS
jgi:hypothetical protein